MDEFDIQDVDSYGFTQGDEHTASHSRSPLKLLWHRETCWIRLLSEWDKCMSKRSNIVKQYCRKGVPSSLRARAWQYLSGSHWMLAANRGKYANLLDGDCSPGVMQQVKQDVHRQFPNHSLFKESNGFGQQALFNILKAYCQMHPEMGYCQAQAPIASAMLIHMPEEEAFWTFVSLCDHYLVDYYKPGLVRLQTEIQMLQELLARSNPKICSHLNHHKVEPIYFAVDWFMCLFTRNLPWSTVVRVLDMFFFEGIKVIFKVALAVLELLLGSKTARKELNSMDSIMIALRHLPTDISQEEVLIPQILKMKHIGTKQLIALYRRNVDSMRAV